MKQANVEIFPYTKMYTFIDLSSNKEFSKFLFSIVFVLSSFLSNGQISYINQAGAGVLSGTNITVNKPLNTLQGNLMIANISTNGNIINATGTGWITLKSASTGTGTTSSRSTILYKIAGVGDATVTSYTFSLGTGATGAAAAILTFGGVDTIKPIDTTASTISTGNSKFPIASGITTSTPNTAIVMFGQVAGITTNATFWNNSFWKSTDPSSLNELYDQNGTNTSVAAAWGSKLNVGATGNGTDSISTSCRWGAILVAIRSCTPKITTQPSATLLLCQGGTLSMSVTSSGTNTYQWKKNGVNISAATSRIYTKANVILADSGSYAVSITNGCGTTTSQNCDVKIAAGISVTIVADYCATPGKIKLSAIVAPNTGSTSGYTYNWSNGGTKDTTYVLTAGTYSVTVSPTSSTSSTTGCLGTVTTSLNVSQELTRNGNFNLGNFGFTCPPIFGARYQYFVDSPNYQRELTIPGRYGIGSNANNYNTAFRGKDHTTGNGNFMIVRGYSFIKPMVWQDTVTVTPNTTYYFSGWAMGIDSSAITNTPILRFTVNGNILGNPLKLPSHGLSPTSPDRWLNFYNTWNSGNATSAIFSIYDSTATFGGNAFGLDDISIGTIIPYLTLTSSPITDTQNVCINTPIQTVTLSYGSGGTPTVTGLPAGVTATISNTTITISGTPTVDGTFNYTVSTLGCNIKKFLGQIISQNSNLILNSAVATTNQSVCINSPILNIIYNAIPSVTAVNVTGLPSGLSYVFNVGILTISGTPTVSGTFTYNITISGGGCSATTSYTGTLTIKARPTVNITVDYCTIPGKALLKAVVTPTGTNTFFWSNGKTTDTISVTTSGTYTVTVTNNLSCQTLASVNVVVGIFLTSPATTNNQNVCLGDTSKRITYSTAGNITGITITGLPNGVGYNYASNNITISGTPTLTGVYTYTINSTVSCGTATTTTGAIKIYANPTVTIKANYCAIPGKIKLKAYPLPAGTYTYLWSNGATSDNTSVNAAGNYSVVVTNINGCSNTASINVSNEFAVNGNFNSGNTGFNTPLFLNQQYNYVQDAPNSQTELTTPGLFGIGTNANNYNNGYQGHDHTTGSGNFMIVHGFPLVQVIAWEKTISVTPNTIYYFSAWAQGLDSLNNNPILKFTVNGNQLGTNLTLSNHGQSSTSPDNWSRFYSTWNSGTATSASFAITDVQTFSIGNSFGLDDISIGILSPFISLVSSAATDTQTVCLNTPIDTVVLNIGADSISPVVSGLPPGVNYTFNGYKLTISGSPTSLGVFNYSVSISGCVAKSFNGQITSQGQSLVLTSNTNSNNQSVCIGSPIINIVYNASGNINSNAVSITGLPNGVSFIVSSGMITISGTPTLTGNFNYTLTVTGGICSTSSTTVTTTGTINIINIPTISVLSDYCSQPGRVKLKALPSPAGTYSYYWNNGATTDTTTVDLVGSYTVTATNINGCRATATIAVSTELVQNGNFDLGNTGFITTPSGTQRYVYVPDSINYNRELLLPGKYGIGTNANKYNNLYWGHDHTSGTGNFMIVHGFAFAAPILWQDTVQVTPNTNYYFSAWGMSLNSLGFNGKLKFEINSTQVGNILNLQNRGNSDTSADNWTRFYTIWNSGTSTSAILSITNTQTSFIGNSFGIDDISFASMSPFITLVSSPSTDTQSVCINNPIIPVSLNVGSGGSVIVTGLPPGVNYTFNGLNLLISGSPTVFGTFNYTISLSSTCAPRTFYGQINSLGQSLTLTSAQTTTNQSICLRSPINNIVMQAAGNITNVTATGLPTGLITSFNLGVFTIAGKPTQTGIFNYTVTTIGPSCTASTITGSLNVKASPTATISINSSTLISCSNLSITLTASGGTTYNWNAALGTNPVINVSTPGIYAVFITNTLGCVDSNSITITTNIIPNTSTWLGINSNWNDQANWCGGIPDATKNVVIPSTVTNFPIINTNAICLAVTINSGSTLTINNSGSLSTLGNFNNNGTLINNGKISLTGNTIQSFPGTGLITSMDTLQINNPSGVTLNNSIFIQKELRPTSGILALGDFDITLKSNSTATASVSVIGNNAGFTYGTGRFVVERYIATGTANGQHGKSWQFIAAPIRGLQTIKQAWQENAAIPNQNLNPGFGTQITGESANALSLGFDSRTSAPSMKIYDSATNTFIGVPNTISYPIQNTKGYMIFIRGNRNDTSFTQVAEPTTLRERGMIYARGNEAPPIISLAAGKYQSVANPYPSTIDFSNNTGIIFNRSTSIDNLFYVWDPTLSGSNNLGGYQTISAINNWIPVPGGTTYYPASVSNPKIQSGQAFFMHAAGAGGTVTFTEQAKTAGSNLVNRITSINNSNTLGNQFFETNLFVLNNGVMKLADGNLLAFNTDYSNELNADDAIKLSNTGENFGILSNGKVLAIEAKQMPTSNDTIYYSISNLRIGNYRIKFQPTNLISFGLTPYLIDQYLQSTTTLSIEDTTSYDFSVTNISSSAANNRFLIVYRLMNALPLSFSNFIAFRKNENTIQLNWSIEEEIDISYYDIERSFDGINFTSIQKINPLMNNGGFVNYQSLDSIEYNDDLFYRIKANKNNGTYLLSKIAKVKGVLSISKINVFPNPVPEKTLSLQYTGLQSGQYTLEICSANGQLLFSKQIKFVQNHQIHKIQLPKTLPSGYYILKLKSLNDLFLTKEMIVK